MKHAELTIAERLVANVMSDTFNAKTGRAHYTLPKLSKLAGTSLSVVKRCIKELKDKGFIWPVRTINAVGTKEYQCEIPQSTARVCEEPNTGLSRPQSRVTNDLHKTKKNNIKSAKGTLSSEFNFNVSRLDKNKNFYAIPENDSFWAPIIQQLPKVERPELFQDQGIQAYWLVTLNDLRVIYEKRQNTPKNEP
ncbi:hypothetical protein [Pseudovibrio ascidiaceicola]|uniref:hypothetical protein n=1 Tax=Pseudovibrio ascidiaceicola TaxID=285279 RepID=UPI001358D850|nr:hypothetical protein [Pseudovibrio ascidiaceicola]